MVDVNDRPDLEGRCGTCARFVHVVETIDEAGEVKRKGECLLAVWPPPIYETNKCSSYAKVEDLVAGKRRAESRAVHGRGGSVRPRRDDDLVQPTRNLDFSLPEELLDMDKNEFRQILRDVIRDELGVGEVRMAARFIGGEVIIKPGKDGTQEKRIPIDAFFHKVVMVRDKLRVLEQKINAHAQLSDDDKVQMQQYVTACYGSLTTFNILFSEKNDTFIGQKGDE
jgi:hypothetical protein